LGFRNLKEGGFLAGEAKDQTFKKDLASIFVGGSVCRNTELPEQEAENVGIFLDDFVDGPSAGVSGLRVV